MGRHRGSRGGASKRANRPAKSQISDAQASNAIDYDAYMQWFASIAAMRYTWEGLPDTVSERVIEQLLFYRGFASVAFDSNGAGVFIASGAGAFDRYDVYNDPIHWQALSLNGREIFDVTAGKNGLLCYDRRSRSMFQAKFTMLAKKLELYSRAETVNLHHQFTPFLVSAPEEKIIDVQNALAATVAGEIAVIGYDTLSETVKNSIGAISTGVAYSGEQLQRGALGVWAEFYRIIGIPTLQFEKTERMITGEAQTAYAPARLALDDGLEGRRDFCEAFNRAFDMGASVSINPQIEQMFSTNEGGDGDGSAVADIRIS